MEEVIKIIRVLGKHWLMLVVAPIISMSIIYMLTNGQPRKYRSEAKLYLNLQENQVTSLNGEGMKQYQVHTYFQNITELIKSKRTLARTRLLVLKRGLEGDHLLSYGLPDSTVILNRIKSRLMHLETGNLTLNNIDDTDSLILAYFDYHQLSTERLVDLVSIYRLRDSNYLKFSLEEESPQKAKKIAGCFIDALIAENKFLAKNQIKGHKDVLAELLRKAKLDLDAKVAKLEKYKVENSIINLGEHTKAIVTYLVEIEAERAKLYSTIVGSQKGKNEVLQTAENGNALTIDLSQNAEIVKLKQELKALNRKSLMASLNNQSLEAIPEIQVRIEKTKKELSDKLYQMSNKLAYDPTRIQLELANRYLAYDLDEEMSKDILSVIDDEIARVQSYAKKFAPFESTIGTYDREIYTAQNAYLTLLNKLSVAESVEYGSGENVIEVIDPPSYPEKPLASKRVILITAGGMAIFVLIAGFFVVMTLLDKSILTVSDYERQGKFNVIGAIPNLRQHKHDATANIHDQQVVTLARAVRTSAATYGNVILMVSATEGTGKSYVAGQIFKVLNCTDYKVAVVNASPQSHYEEGQIDMRPLVEDHSILRNETTILKSIKQLQKENDLVLLLIPPSDLSADINIWLEHFPHFLYLFRAGRIFSKSDRRLEALLESKKTCIPGAVLSQMEIENMEDLVGEVSKNRSQLRIWVKRLLTRNLQAA
ncbi:MAG: hypothetical protein AAGC88_03135 [Bacteroidota bacterium]